MSTVNQSEAAIDKGLNRPRPQERFERVINLITERIVALRRSMEILSKPAAHYEAVAVEAGKSVQNLTQKAVKENEALRNSRMTTASGNLAPEYLIAVTVNRDVIEETIKHGKVDLAYVENAIKKLMVHAEGLMENDAGLGLPQVSIFDTEFGGSIIFKLCIEMGIEPDAKMETSDGKHAYLIDKVMEAIQANSKRGKNAMASSNDEKEIVSAIVQRFCASKAAPQTV